MRAMFAMTLAAATLGAPTLHAQTRAPDPAALLQAQTAALHALDWMHGRWQGEAWSTTPQGRHDIIQTERIGPMLGGSILVMEGKSFERDGQPATFNAFGVMSFDPARGAYTLHSYAQGRAGDFPMTVTPDGYVWGIPAGPMTIRYTATHNGEAWREVGDLVRPDQTATRIFEMNLRRLGDSDWPMAGQATAPQP